MLEERVPTALVCTSLAISDGDTHCIHVFLSTNDLFMSFVALSTGVLFYLALMVCVLGLRVHGGVDIRLHVATLALHACGWR